MSAFVTTLFSAIVQVALIGIVPLAWWFCTARKKQSLTSWLGLIRPRARKPVLVVIVAAAMAAMLLGTTLATRPFMNNASLSVVGFGGLGWAALPTILVHAWLQTSFWEEAFFRGFLLGRLETRLGFHLANACQALLFAVSHLALLLISSATVNPVLIVGSLAVPAVFGWAMGWIKRTTGGSILPTWLIHGLANTATSLTFALA